MPPKKKSTADKAVQSGDLKPLSKVESVPNEVLARILGGLYPHTMVVEKQTPQKKASPGGVYRDEPCVQDMNDQVISFGWQPERESPERSEVVSFTYHLHVASAVCQQWRDVILHLPEYWSRVIVFVDRDVKPADIKERIDRARDLPLDILVTRSPYGGAHYDNNDNEAEIKQEKTRAKKIMKLLRPLIPRCRSFVFDVEYSSSLPFISQSFRGTAPRLRVLKLQCRVDTKDAVLPRVPKIKRKDEFIFPRLSTVVLDGATFMDACNIPSFMRQLKDMYLDTLSISRLTAPNPDDEDEDDEYDPAGFDIYNLADHLANIGYTRHLTLAYIDVAYDPGTEEGGEHQWRVDNLTIKGQDEPWVEELNCITFGSSLCYYHLINSSIYYESMMMAHHLRLEGIIDFGNFGRTMERHFGNRLDIVKCNRFMDYHLDAIANGCRFLRRLYLVDCPNITIGGLKLMLADREALASKNDERPKGCHDTSDDVESIVEVDEEDDTQMTLSYASRLGRKTFTPIHRLHVKGHQLKLTTAEHQWFSDRLEFFSWD
ncbi:hypothetical protein NLJ89_g4953 [Agrocybe chaxingu]|uniref:F-box domain-containing protein n=1 Tax=Agrocybe chaxingu TaxID=84603 RepID=A0A9W8MU30_9AGAR|nr:hypothetical protein NLJ89_g4953 [Agrocybe chaxingu]